ncbi:CARDB domain-containing protein [Roseovarius aestuariivivens]|uniref:CARDB domain-containing protein n=1 Tax=Roseovarius aestuariivivens TaxID=1888910 RepID=UPI0010816179|nr:CARDB domain-containing protein [Roseovarius aestuariivivens]
MTHDKKTIAIAGLLAFGLICSAASAADLRLRTKAADRKIVKPSVSRVLKGAMPNLPDLVVIPITANASGMPNTGVCGAWSAGYVNVKFKVRNQGAGSAESTSLNVILQKNGQYAGGAVLPVQSLNPGQETTVTFPVPAAAQPGYSQSVKVLGQVDASHYIAETSEFNNSHTGFCHGPTP